MSCSNCTPAKNLRICGEDITIGTISSSNTDVYIYVRDIITGKIYRQETTSDGDGVVTLAMDDNNRFFQPIRTYEIWVTLTDAASQEDTETLTIHGGEYDCIQAEFERITDADGNTIADSTLQEIEIE